jgi:hypothetical protein
MNRSVPREYSQTTNWNPQSSNYKTTSKTTMIPTGTYPQQQQQQLMYQISPQQQQQQQIFFGTYQYPTLSPAVKKRENLSIIFEIALFQVVQVLAPIEHWPSTGFSTPFESYSYPTASKIHFLSCFSLIYLFDQIIYQPIPINLNIIHKQNMVNLIIG